MDKLNKFFKMDKAIYVAAFWILLTLIGLFSMFAFQSCKPTLATCNRLYPPQSSEKIVIKDSITPKYIQLPGDTSYIMLPFNCVEDSLKVVINLFQGKIGKYQTAITYQNGQLKFWQQRFNDSIQSFDRYREKGEVKVEKVSYEVVKKVVPVWCWWLIIAVVAYIGLKLSPIRKFIP